MKLKLYPDTNEVQFNGKGDKQIWQTMYENSWLARLSCLEYGMTIVAIFLVNKKPKRRSSSRHGWVIHSITGGFLSKTPSPQKRTDCTTGTTFVHRTYKGEDYVANTQRRKKKMIHQHDFL